MDDMRAVRAAILPCVVLMRVLAAVGAGDARSQAAGGGGEGGGVHPSPPLSSRQKLTTLDSEAIVANLMGSMNDAFRLLRSASVTPRATEQAPQTYTGTFALTTFSISSVRGGYPTPWMVLAITSLAT